MISSKKILRITVAFLAAFVPFVVNAQQTNPSPDPTTPTNPSHPFNPSHPLAPPVIPNPEVFTTDLSSCSVSVYLVLVEGPASPAATPDVIIAQLQLVDGMLHFDFNQSISVYSVILKHNGRQYGYYFNWTTMSLEVPFPGDEGVWEICVQTTDGRTYCVEGIVSSGGVRSDAPCDFIP